MLDLSKLGKKKPANADDLAEHSIVIVFPDDHSLDGLKATIVGITPEQMAVAAFYVERYANMALGQRDAAMQQARAEADAVAVGLAQERR